MPGEEIFPRPWFSWRFSFVPFRGRTCQEPFRRIRLQRMKEAGTERGARPEGTYIFHALDIMGFSSCGRGSARRFAFGGDRAGENLWLPPLTIHGTSDRVHSILGTGTNIPGKIPPGGSSRSAETRFQNEVAYPLCLTGHPSSRFQGGSPRR